MPAPCPGNWSGKRPSGRTGAASSSSSSHVRGTQFGGARPIRVGAPARRAENLFGKLQRRFGSVNSVFRRPEVPVSGALVVDQKPTLMAKSCPRNRFGLGPQTVGEQFAAVVEALSVGYSSDLTRLTSEDSA